jgi:hypothetical protein
MMTNMTNMKNNSQKIHCYTSVVAASQQQQSLMINDVYSELPLCGICMYTAASRESSSIV